MSAEQEPFFHALPDPAYQLDSNARVLARNRAADARHGDWLPIGASLREKLPQVADAMADENGADGAGMASVEVRGRDAESLIAQIFGAGTCRYVVLRDVQAEAGVLPPFAGEADFHAMADSVPVMLWTARSDQSCDWFNKAWLEFTGRALREEVGEGWTEGLHPDDAARCRSTWRASFARREAFAMEYRLRRNDGEYRWVLDTGVPRFAAGERFAGYIGGCVEMHAQKALEASLRAQAEALEQAERRKDEFLGLLAHELRDPLAPIHAAAQLLQARSAEENQRAAAAAIIQRQVKSLVRLVADLRDVSRLLRGTIELQRQPMPLAEAIQDALAAVRPVLEQQRQDLAVELPRDALVVHADRARLAQAVANLLDNAARFSPPESRIVLNVTQVESHARIAVRDPGIGIAPALLPSVWEPFVQLDRRARRGHGGLGLGLALVRTLVRLHGGEAEAHSEGPGQGSEFVLRLPLADDC